MLNLRTRFGIPGILSVIALVFAMTGGAFAAKYVITSTKQIKPKVLKQLKGKTGPAGPQGPAGTNGTNGTNGKDGAKGATGTNGKSVLATPIPGEPGEECEGVEGTEFEVEESGVQTFACNGAKGPTGPAGPITGVLPSEATLKGVWVARKPDFFSPSQSNIAVSISYGLSPVSAPTMEAVKPLGYNGEGEVTEEHKKCPGKASNPKAKKGFLCIYTSTSESALFTGPPQSPEPKSGAFFVVVLGEEGVRSGTWAVTAP